MTKNIIEELAPYPKSEETATAEALYRHLLVATDVTFLRRVRPFQQPDGPKDPGAHMQALEAFIAEWSTLHLLRVLMGKPDILESPEHESVADYAARSMWAAYEDGGAAAELLYDWLEEAGINPDVIAATVREAEARRLTEETTTP